MTDAPTMAVRVKSLVWEQVSDRCWDADGMGKLYRVMAREGGAVIRHSHLDRGGDRFESVEAAKDAAQVDYEVRVISALEPSPAPVAEPMVWRWRPKSSALWIYDPDKEWLERQSFAEIDAQPLYAHPAPVRHAPPETPMSACPHRGDGRTWEDGVRAAAEAARTQADMFRAEAASIAAELGEGAMSKRAKAVAHYFDLHASGMEAALLRPEPTPSLDAAYHARELRMTGATEERG